MAAMRGMDVTVLRPDGFELPDAVMDKVRQAAEISGGSVKETSDRSDAMEGAQVIYVNSWTSAHHYGDKLAEDELKLELRNWCVGEPFHALPAGWPWSRRH